jgi:hypothetical protein
MSEKKKEPSGEWWGTFFVGATAGQLTFVLLFIHMLASGCESKMVDREVLFLAATVDERLLAIEQHLASDFEECEECPEPVKCPEPGNVMVKIEGEEEEVSCWDAARMVSGCDFQLEMCCEDLCKAEMKIDPSSAINSSYCGWCGPEKKDE